MRRLWLIVTVPLTIVLAVFAVANRDDVALSLWPFDVQMQLPLFVLALGTLALGLLIGAFLMWIPLLGWRHRAYAETRRADRLGAELAALRPSDGVPRTSGALLPPS
jgi:putative membrane protein